jgi:hypothetical protein
MTTTDQSPRDSGGIVRWEALPKPRGGARLNRRDLLTMEIIGRFLGAKTIQVDALGDDFIRGAPAPESHPTHRLALEATQIASNLNSDPSLQSTPSNRSAPWLDQIAEIEKIDSNAQRFLAIANLFEQNEPLAAKLASILESIQLLRSFTGAQVEIETVDRKDAAINLDKPYFTPLEIDLSDE